MATADVIEKITKVSDSTYEIELVPETKTKKSKNEMEGITEAINLFIDNAQKEETKVYVEEVKSTQEH